MKKRQAKKKLSTSEVEYIARLAKLSLTGKEVKKFQEQLSDILSYIEKLNELKTENVTPTAQVTGLENIFRPDRETNASFTPKTALSNTKAKLRGFFKVKGVFEK